LHHAERFQPIQPEGKDGDRGGCEQRQT